MSVVDVIEKLYYGMIHPFEREAESKALLEQIAEAETTLLCELTKEQREIFELYSHCRTELQCDGELAMFREGVELGIQLMITVRE